MQHHWFAKLGVVGWFLLWLLYLAVGIGSYKIADLITHQHHAWRHMLLYGSIWATGWLLCIWVGRKSRAE